MKTKLLLLFLVIFSFSNAQVTFSENFDAASPNLTGWVYSDYLLNTSLPCSGTKSLTQDFTLVNAIYRVTTKNFVSDGNPITFNFNYKMLQLGSGLPPNYTYYVSYFVNNGVEVYALSLQNTTFPTSCTASPTATIPASAVPAGSNVKISVQFKQTDRNFRIGLDDFSAVQTPPNGVPIVSNICATPLPTSADISYRLNANNGATTSIIKYGTSSTSLTSQISGFSASTATNGSVSIAGLNSSTPYFYQVEATNSMGTYSSPIYSFTTGNFQPIAEYNFNNTMGNINGNSPFDVNGSIFIAGRDSNSQMALQTNNLGRSAIIPNLPVGSAARTVSIWYRTGAAATSNTLFVYGASGGENAYGVSFNNTNTWYNFAWNTNTSFSNTSDDGQWHHLVTTFDSTKTSKVYVDGVLKNTVVQNGWNTSTNGNVFWLAGQFGNTSPFIGAVDDLKIYDYALTQAQITALFSNTTLGTTENLATNTEISIYPNPAKDFVNILSENKIKSVEIYNMAGQKVLEAKETKINTSGLKSGIYLMKITDVKNNVTSKKLIIK